MQLDAQREFLRNTRNDHGAEKRKELEHNQRVAAELAAEEQNKAIASMGQNYTWDALQ